MPEFQYIYRRTAPFVFAAAVAQTNNARTNIAQIWVNRQNFALSTITPINEKIPRKHFTCFTLQY